MSNEGPVELQLWRGAIFPALIVALIGNIIAYFLRGTSGLVAGMFSLIIVVIFFTTHIVIAKFADRLDPKMVMVLALGSYFMKVMLMGLFLLLTMKLTQPTFLDRSTFGIMAIAITSAWLAGEIRAFLKLKLVLKTTGE